MDLTGLGSCFSAVLLLSRQYQYQTQWLFIQTRKTYFYHAKHTLPILTTRKAACMYSEQAQHLDQRADGYSVICRDIRLFSQLQQKALAISLFQTPWIPTVFSQGIKADTPFNIQARKVCYVTPTPHLRCYVIQLRPYSAQCI
jgi:hypothetical protein